MSKLSHSNPGLAGCFGDILEGHKATANLHGAPMDVDAMCGVIDQGIAELANLRRQIARMTAALQECAEYFEDRADADCDQDGYIPNEEMKLLGEVREALGERF